MDPLPDLAKLQSFVRLAETGSLTIAASATGLTPSALSRQLASLEASLGIRLFHRTGRGVVPTPAGRKLLGDARNLLAQAESFARASRAGGASGSVRIGMLHGYIPGVLPELYRRVRAKYPAMRLHCVEGSSGQLEEWVTHGEVDIAFVSGDADEARGEIHRFSETLHLIGSPDAPLTRGATVSFRQLHEVALVLPGVPNSMRGRLQQLARRAGIGLNIVLEADSMIGQIAFVAEGLGYAVSPPRAVSAALPAGRVSAARIVEPTIKRTIRLALGTQRPAAAETRDIAVMLRLILGQQADRR